MEGVDHSDPLYWYGSDRQQIDKLIAGDPGMGELISKKLDIIKAQIVWAVRGEMARTLEDCLARRIRIIQLDAGEALSIAPVVASIMAAELGKDMQWENSQVEAFTGLANMALLD